MIYSVAGDLFNQVPNVRRIAAAAQRLEFMVVHDNFMTPTARHADIVLPATTFWERNDVHTPWAGAGHYAIFMKQAIEPMGECRNDFDICSETAAVLCAAGALVLCSDGACGVLVDSCGAGPFCADTDAVKQIIRTELRSFFPMPKRKLALIASPPHRPEALDSLCHLPPSHRATESCASRIPHSPPSA